MRPGLVVAATLVALCSAIGAYAGSKYDSGPKHRSDKPWADGVSKANQDKANKLFEEGNVYFEQSKYTEALARFEDAIKLWDHPSIEYNVARCLIKMKQTRLAYDHLKKALEYGQAPLGADYGHAKDFMEVLEGGLATLVIKTTQDGVVVKVDAEVLLQGAGEKSEMVEKGRHSIVVSKDGFETDVRDVEAKAGETIRQEITLDPAKVKIKRELVNYERRWQWWVPWSAMGGGIVLGLIGGGVEYIARNEMHTFDQDYLNQCPSGCTKIPVPLQKENDTAVRNGHIAAGFFITGGLALGTGLVLAYLNRPHKLEEHPKVQPDVEVTQHGVTAGITFSFD